MYKSVISNYNILLQLLQCDTSSLINRVSNGCKKKVGSSGVVTAGGSGR